MDIEVGSVDTRYIILRYYRGRQGYYRTIEVGSVRTEVGMADTEVGRVTVVVGSADT